jgi:hypothetical protein
MSLRRRFCRRSSVLQTLTVASLTAARTVFPAGAALAKLASRVRPPRNAVLGSQRGELRTSHVYCSRWD